MIITPEIIRLVHKIEATGKLQPYFPQLLQTLHHNCQSLSKNTNNFPNTNTSNLPLHYPLVNGYAVSFDPLTQERELLEHWNHYGFVVGKNVVSNQDCQAGVERILEISNGFLKGLPTDSHGVSLLSRGFFEIYHDNCLAQIRQSLRLYLYHVVLWGSPFLWTTFDRLGVKLPEGGEGLPLHVDQNPTVHPDFRTIQGVLALDDCPLERGTFVGVPNSRTYFSQYSEFIAPGYKGEYILLPESSSLYSTLKEFEQPIPLQKGDIVSWDSRTTHRNSTNYSDINRYVAYVSTGLAKEDNLKLVEARLNNYHSGLGENYRDAYMHASKKPRFTDLEFIKNTRQPEILNELGMCLYGMNYYKDYL